VTLYLQDGSTATAPVSVAHDRDSRAHFTRAELDVFKSDFTINGVPDYSLQIAQQSRIHALCLITHDVDPQALSMPYEGVYYSYYTDLI